MNILLTYDFLTTNLATGKRLCSQLSFLAEILTSLGIDMTIDDKHHKDFPIREFFASSGLSYDDQRFEVIDLDVLGQDGMDMIWSHIAGHDLLLTYELSRQTKRLFDKSGIPYIDIWMSPIRFHKDIMFSFYSNTPAIQEKLQDYVLDESTLYEEAKKLTGHCQHFLQDNTVLQEDSALIIGQMLQDKAVMDEKGFLSLVDYKDELTDISTQYSQLYFLKHPYMDEHDLKILLEAFIDIDNLTYLQNANVYSLLSRQEIKSVIALSSSVLYEAKYFGKETLYLFRPVLDKRYVNIYKSFYQTRFWSEVLELKTPALEIEYLNHDNDLRNRLGAFYAYGDLLEDSRTYENLIRLYKFIDALDRQKKYVLYGFGSIGRLIFPLLRDNIKAIIDEGLSSQGSSMYDGIPIIKDDRLQAQDNVLISAFKYNVTITNRIKQYNCTVFTISI